MKGIVFTEFLEMVEDRFSPALADRIIAAADLPSAGAYTTVGTYDHTELVDLVTHLSTATGIATADLVRTFGTHLFGRFAQSYPHLFDGIGSTFAFLERLDQYIHVEVRKLYPDTELPQFTCAIVEPHALTLTYRSARPFADFAEGLLMGCIAHFGEPIELHRENLPGQPGTAARFALLRRG